MQQLINNNLHHSSLDKITNLIKLIIHTRDIDNGKGETDLSHFLLWNLIQIDTSEYFFNNTNNVNLISKEKYKLIQNNIIFEFTKLIINSWIIPQSTTNTSFGSWKDIKYFLNYYPNNRNYRNIPNKTDSITYAVIEYCIQLYVDCINYDLILMDDKNLYHFVQNGYHVEIKIWLDL